VNQGEDDLFLGSEDGCPEERGLVSEGEERTTSPPISLSVANLPEYLPLLVHAVRDFARLTAFPEEAGERAATIVGGMAAALIDPALEPLAGGSIDLTCRAVPGGMMVVLHDEGPPFDPSRSGSAAEIVHSLLQEGSPDWIGFRNLGRGGKEVEIMLHLPGRGEEGGDEASGSPPDESELRFRGDRPGADWPDVDDSLLAQEIGEGSGLPPPDELTVGLLRPGQAGAVSHCIFDAYRLTYFKEEMYRPLRIAELNRNGDMVSAVATAPDGSVAGHFALVLNDERSVADLAVAATRRAWRGRGIAQRLAAFLIEEARRRELYGLYCEALTAHPYTQRLTRSLGFGVCGARLMWIPMTERLYGVSEHERRRRSAMLMFRYLREPSRNPLDVPRQHRDMIARLYTWIGAPDRLVDSPIEGLQASAESGEGTTIRTVLDPSLGNALLVVETHGADLSRRLDEELSRIKDTEVLIVEARLNLQSPGAAAAVDELERHQFVFVGVRPGGPGVDWLLMQRFSGVRVDYDALVLDSEEARRLLDYVRAHDPDAS
jgi:GNAT superfamily N-acetyltransferase